MKYFIITIFVLLFGIVADARLRCQGFNNNDDKVTIVFIDDDPGDEYMVSDVELIPIWKGEEYPATSVETTVKDGVATVTLTFPHIIRFSNPRVFLRINGKKTKLKVCQ